MKEPSTKKYPFKVIPEDDRRPAEITAQIRELEAKKSTLDRKDLAAYKLAKRDLNREIYRLSKIGIPDDLSWRHNDGRPAFLPKEQGIMCVRLTSDQRTFCQRMSPKGNVSMGVRSCIDFTMAARQLPVLPSEFDDDAS